MDARLFCFAVDLIDDLDGSLDDIGSYGNGVILAAAYHTARDYLPHNKRRRVHLAPAGLAFPPDLSRYPASLPPHPQLPVCEGRDLLAETIVGAHARGMRADAWTVYMHHDSPDLTAVAGRVVNAFGDVNPVALCPGSSVARAYALALTADVASRQPDGIFGEALCYQPFAHGFHHERAFTRLGGLANLLLAFCFCADCVAAARAAGLDVDALRAWVRATIDGPGGQQPLMPRDELCRQADADGNPGAMAGYLALRQDHVTSLVAACAQVARSSGVDFTFLDTTHALAEPHTTDGGVPSWQIGVDLAAVAAHCEIATAFYVDSLKQLKHQLGQARAALERAPEAALLRPMGGDLREGADLAGAVRCLRDAGAGWIGYYHYGLVPLPALGRVRAAHRRLEA